MSEWRRFWQIKCTGMFHLVSQQIVHYEYNVHVDSSDHVICGYRQCNSIRVNVIPAVPMLCAEITDRKQTSEIIRCTVFGYYIINVMKRTVCVLFYRLLNGHFPLSEYTHLKRVRGGERERAPILIVQCIVLVMCTVHVC